MAEPRWIPRFMGGVADAAHERALLCDAAGHAVLVDLSRGRCLWRSAQPMRPLALDAALAFALLLGPARAVAIDVASGVAQWHSAPLDWPAWAAASAQAAGLDGASDLHAGWAGPISEGEGADLLLAWDLRRPAGGMQRAGSPVQTRGACRLARADGVIDPLGSAEALVEAAWASVAANAGGPHAMESADPAVLVQQQLQGVRYALAQRPAGPDADGTSHLVLEAAPSTAPATAPATAAALMIDAAAATLHLGWRCVLDAAPAPRRKPGPPQPRS